MQGGYDVTVADHGGRRKPFVARTSFTHSRLAFEQSTTAMFYG
jgi:hypothetical protein